MGTFLKGGGSAAEDRAIVRDDWRFSQSLKGQAQQPKQKHRQFCCDLIVSHGKKQTVNENLKNI